MVGSGVGGYVFHVNDRVKDSQGDVLLSSDGGILETVGLELPREALVEPGVCLRVGWFSGAGKTIQEVGRCNHPL